MSDWAEAAAVVFLLPNNGASGVFTNGGHTVPTMIIMAFAIRLADHLTRLGKST